MRLFPETLLSGLPQTYGGKRAFVTTIWHRTRLGIGAFATYQQIRWVEVSRVVFVCKGNIVRSAYAEHRFRALAPNQTVTSAGLGADPGKPSDARAQRVASRRNVDLRGHRSEHIDNLRLYPGDLLVAFEPSHAQTLKALACTYKGVQVTLIGLWSPQRPWVYLHDPYGLSEAYFDRCFQRIECGLSGILAHLNGA